MAFVYFVSANGEDGPIKIGYTTTSIERRLMFLQTGNPNKLRIIENINFIEASDALRIEGLLHQRLASRRLMGEWFAVTHRQALKALAEIGDELGFDWFCDDPNGSHHDIIPYKDVDE